MRKSLPQEIQLLSPTNKARSLSRRRIEMLLLNHDRSSQRLIRLLQMDIKPDCSKLPRIPGSHLPQGGISLLPSMSNDPRRLIAIRCQCCNDGPVI